MATCAGFASILYIWLKLDGVRLFNEVILELALIVLLGLAVTTFTRDTEGFRRRIRITVGLTYGAGLFSVVAFGITIFLSAHRGRKDVGVRSLSYRLSQTAWFLFLFTGIAAMIAYLTVSDETDAVRFGAGESVVMGMLYPSFIAIGVIIAHMICSCANCCCRQGKKWYTWRDTSAYHELTQKILLTIASACLLLLPLAMAFNGGSFDTNSEDEQVSNTDYVAFFVDLIAAGIHRMALAEHDRELGSQRAEALKQEHAAASNAALSDVSTTAMSAPSQRPIPAPGLRVGPPAGAQGMPQAPPPAASSVASSTASAEPLPAGWKVLRAKDGRLYYHDAASGTSTWSRPVGARPAASAAPPPVRLAPGWAPVRSKDGRTYYFHAESGTSSWAMPTA